MAHLSPRKPKTPAHALVKQMKRARIAAHLGITTNAVSQALSSGRLPSRWYGPLKMLGIREGIAVPLSAFRWIEKEQHRDQGSQATPR